MASDIARYDWGMRYFTSDTHFGHPLVSVLRGYLNNGRLRAEYAQIRAEQGDEKAHEWIKSYVKENQTSFKAISDVEAHENAAIEGINATVGRDDELWLLGDISFRCTVAHTLDCLRRINCRHLHMIIGNHDRNFRLRFNDALYEDVFETIDDYREIGMELPVLGDADGSAAVQNTVQNTVQNVGLSHFPRLAAMIDGHGVWPDDLAKFADDAPTTESWLIYGHTHQPTPDGTDSLCVNIGMDAWDMKPVSETQIVEWLTAANRKAAQTN